MTLTLCGRHTPSAQATAPFHPDDSIEVREQETEVNDEPVAPADEDVTIANEYYEVTFTAETGTMASIKNLESGVEAQVSLDIGFYNSSTGGCTAGVSTRAEQELLHARQRREA